THWAYCDQLGRAEPTADVRPDALYIRSDNVYTSAGVTAGMDMALAMVEDDFGRQAAISVAQQLVMFLKRPGGQSQFSRLLKAQSHAGGRLEAIALWIAGHLDADLTVPLLARRAAMSSRNFARRFVEECGATPAVFVEQMRVEAARCQLQDTRKPIEEIARRCGFRNEQRLRRAFLRSLGVAPADYRVRFRSDVEPKGMALFRGASVSPIISTKKRP
ncbi:MAG: GlxA family transcriptional regulator, partial [Rudaea sp.]